MYSSHTQRVAGLRPLELRLESRRKQRYETRLPFQLSLFDSKASEDGRPSHSVTLTGYTNDIGAEGLALVGPLIRFGYRYLMGRNSVLHVVLYLPTGPVNIEASPMRYVQMDAQAMGAGFIMTGPADIATDEAEISCLISVRITGLSDGDRARYLEYLRQLEQSEAETITISTGQVERWQMGATANLA